MYNNTVLGDDALLNNFTGGRVVKPGLVVIQRYATDRRVAGAECVVRERFNPDRRVAVTEGIAIQRGLTLAVLL